jgi:hypothetical protein
MQKGDNPLGNQVSFELIDARRMMHARLARTMVHGTQMARQAWLTLA